MKNVFRALINFNSIPDVYNLITKVRTPKGGISLVLDDFRFVKYTSDFTMSIHIFRCTQYKKDK